MAAGRRDFRELQLGTLVARPVGRMTISGSSILIVVIAGCGGASPHATDAPTDPPSNPPVVRCEDGEVPAFPGAEGFAACVTGGRGGQELFGDLRRAIGVDGTEPIASCVHVFAGAMGHLAHGCDGLADGPGDLVVVETERLAQHEHRSFVGSERLEENQHRH